MTILADIRRILAELVGFPTISSDSNLALIEWVETYLDGIAAHIQRIPSAQGDKANLWVRLGPDRPGGIVLSGHTDVVPVKGQDWHTDPFTLHEAQNRLYGRGTADMKSFLALALGFAPRWTHLSKPVHLALSYDEEVGCLGAPDLIATIAASKARPDMVWVGEPTNWQIVSAHKGICVHEVILTGREAHSSLPDAGVSAIHEAVTLMNVLRDIAKDCAANTASNGTAPQFDPPGATLTIGQIQGGEAANILAGSCRFVFDLRLPPDMEVKTVLTPFYHAVEQAHTRIRAKAPEGGVKLRSLCAAPALAAQAHGLAERTLRHLTEANTSHAVAYAAEAGQFQQAGFSAVICGPGSIEQAHRPNEWIELSELEKGITLFERLTNHMETASEQATH